MDRALRGTHRPVAGTHRPCRRTHRSLAATRAPMPITRAPIAATRTSLRGTHRPCRGRHRAIETTRGPIGDTRTCLRDRRRCMRGMGGCVRRLPACRFRNRRRLAPEAARFGGRGNRGLRVQRRAGQWPRCCAARWRSSSMAASMPALLRGMTVSDTQCRMSPVWCMKSLISSSSSRAA